MGAMMSPQDGLGMNVLVLVALIPALTGCFTVGVRAGPSGTVAFDGRVGVQASGIPSSDAAQRVPKAVSKTSCSRTTSSKAVMSVSSQSSRMWGMEW